MLPFWSADKIKQTVRHLSEELNEHYGGVMKPVTFVCVLNGAGIFFADLIRHLRFDIRVLYLKASSYGNETTTSGSVTVTLVEDLIRSFYPDRSEDLIRNHHVVLVDDIFDSGLTMKKLYTFVEKRDPLSTECCVLLYKNIPRKVHITTFPKFIGGEMGNQYVFGYGMDFAGTKRHLPDIYYLQDPISDHKHLVDEYDYPEQEPKRPPVDPVIAECLRFLILFTMLFCFELFHLYTYE